MSTQVQPNLSDPNFEECFHLIIRDGVTAELKLRVMDEYKWVEDQCVGESRVCAMTWCSTVIRLLCSEIIIWLLFFVEGSVTVPVIDIIRAGCVEEEYVLDVKSQEVFLACKLEWSTAVEEF